MYASLRFGLTCFVLAIACQSTLTVRAQDNAAPKPVAVLPADFAFVPNDASAFVTVRVSNLLDKLGLRERLNRIAPLAMLEKEFGVPLQNVERVTIIMSTSRPQNAAVVASMTEKIAADTILKERTADVKKVQIQGKDCYLLKDKNMALCCVNDHTLLIADTEEALKRCLKQAQRDKRYPGPIAEALNLACKHDVCAWTDVELLTTAGLPLPNGLESASVSLDVGNQIELQLSVACADADAIAWTQKSLQAVVDVARMQLLMAPAMMGLAQLAPGQVGDTGIGENWFVPIKLMRTAEKGLQKTRIKAEGMNVVMDVAIPMEARTLRSEVLGLLRLVNAEASGSHASCIGLPVCGQTCQGAMTLPSAKYLEHPPQYLPPNSVVGAPVGAPSGNSTSGLAGSVVEVPSAEPKKPVTATPASLPSTLVAPPPIASNPMDASPSASQRAAIPATYVAPSAGGPIKITVANVHKLSAQVFEMTGDGKLKFVEKISAGDAVDLKMTSGLRYLAVFMGKPDGEPALEAFTAQKANSVWLLRP